MELKRFDTWCAYIGYYAINSHSGNPLLKGEWRGPQISRAEFDYCVLGLSEEETGIIRKELDELGILIVDVKTSDKKRLAKLLIKYLTQAWCASEKIFRTEVPYNDLLFFIERFPFLKQDMRLLIKCVESNGLQVTDRPDELSEGKIFKYETEEERQAARKKSNEKYKKKKNIENAYSLYKVLEAAEVDPYKFLEID